MYCERTILSLFSLILSLNAYSFIGQDTCASMAKYSPGSDTVVTSEHPILILNQSINSNSFTWYVNDSVSSSAKDLVLNPTTGVIKIMLVASNGGCNDTAYSYVILEGNIRGQYDDFKSNITLPERLWNHFVLPGTNQTDTFFQEIISYHR